MTHAVARFLRRLANRIDRDSTPTVTFAPDTQVKTSGAIRLSDGARLDMTGCTVKIDGNQIIHAVRRNRRNGDGRALS